MAEKLQYTVDKQLVAMLSDGATLLEGRVISVSRELKGLRALSSAIPPVNLSGQLLLQLGPMALLKGTGRMSRFEAAGNEWEVEISIENIEEAGRAEAVVRLAPLVSTAQRREFLGDLLHRYQDLPQAPWIESTSHLLRLVELAGAINSTTETAALLLAIMEAAREVMEAEASSLILVDPETKELRVEVPTGPARDQITGVRIPPEEGVAGWVARHGTPLVVADASQDPRFYGEIASGAFRTRDLICVPLRSPQGELIGVLQAMNRRGGSIFTPADTPLFSALANQAAIAIERDRLIQQSIAKQLLDKELDVAERIQRGFRPQEPPDIPHLQLAGKSVPAKQVGGDYYDFFAVGQEQVGVIVADISGKGVGAAILMASVRAQLQALVRHGHSLKETVTLINEDLVRDTPPETFVTLFYGILDTRTWQLEFINAGHNSPTLLRSRSGQSESLETGGPIVGFRKGVNYEVGKAVVEEGDVLVLFTDGITESQDEAGGFFGEDRLKSDIRRLHAGTASEILQGIYDSVQSFTRGEPQFDDMTLVVVRRTRG